MHLYWNALKRKWYILGCLASFTLASFLVFTFFPVQPAPAQWGLVFLLTVAGVAFFHEWYLLPRNTNLGRLLHKILHLSYQRTKHLTPKQALFDVNTLCIVLLAIFILGFFSWKYPEHVFWLQWAITILSGVMGTYAFNEEFKSPKNYRQRYIFIFSLGVFLITVLLVYYLSSLGVKYSKDKHEFPVFVVTFGAWFATGIINAQARAAFQLWRDNLTIANNQNKPDA